MTEAIVNQEIAIDPKDVEKYNQMHGSWSARERMNSVIAAFTAETINREEIYRDYERSVTKKNEPARMSVGDLQYGSEGWAYSMRVEYLGEYANSGKVTVQYQLKRFEDVVTMKVSVSYGLDCGNADTNNLDVDKIVDFVLDSKSIIDQTKKEDY